MAATLPPVVPGQQPSADAGIELGLLQYLGPSIQFLLGVYLYREPFDTARGIGFALIWAALVLYTGESLWRMRRAAAA